MLKKLKVVTIKENVVAIAGNFQNAVVLSQMMYWSERVNDFDAYIMEESERLKCNDYESHESDYITNGWFYKKAEELSEETMLGVAANTMRNIIKELEERGFVIERNNPKYKWDKVKQYRVDIVAIQKAMNEKGYMLDGYREQSIIENHNSNNEIRTSNFELRTLPSCGAIPETTTYSDCDDCDYESKDREGSKIRDCDKEQVSSYGIVDEIDVVDTEWADFVAFYEQNIGLFPHDVVTQGDLEDYAKDMGYDVVKKAIEITCRAQVDSPKSYLMAVLKKWKEKEITSIQKAEAFISDYERAKENRKKRQDGKDEEPKKSLYETKFWG